MREILVLFSDALSKELRVFRVHVTDAREIVFAGNVAGQGRALDGRRYLEVKMALGWKNIASRSSGKCGTPICF